jgi:phosphoribosylanthranilate isomerase
LRFFVLCRTRAGAARRAFLRFLGSLDFAISIVSSPARGRPSVSRTSEGRDDTAGPRVCDNERMTRTASVFDSAVQVAGVVDRAEADLLVECGVGFLGFPFRLPVHREDLTEEDAAAIVRRLPRTARAMLITYLADAKSIADLAAFLGVAGVQVHGGIERAELSRLRAIAPHLLLVKSLVVRADNEDALARDVETMSALVDGFITDTFDPATGATGATGRAHDWAVSARLVGLSTRPVILAGGLRPSNVAGAIARVRPAGVDVHTGVEGRDGRKRRDLVASFVAEARRAFRAG